MLHSVMLEIPSYFQRLFTADEIQQRVGELAAEINRNYAGRSVHMVGVLRGASIFLADLVRHLDVECNFDFLSVNSYAGMESTGVVRLVKDLDESVESHHVIVVEDIIDSGLTLNYIREMLISRKPASLALCALLDRPTERETAIRLDYVGFRMDDSRFVVGYGLDFEQKWRQLPDIWAIN